MLSVEMTQLLRDVPAPFMMNHKKLFTMGHFGPGFWQCLIEFGVWKQLFAEIHPDVYGLYLACKNTDQRIQIGKTINPAFFMQYCYGSLS